MDASRAGELTSVLIVEADIIIGVALSIALNIAGYRVLGPTGSVTQALKIGAEERPDIALVDVDLFGRPNGIEVARTLTHQHGTSVLFLTGRPEQARAARDCALGLIVKPYDLTAIPKAVQAVEERRRGNHGVRAPRLLELFR